MPNIWLKYGRHSKFYRRACHRYFILDQTYHLKIKGIEKLIAQEKIPVTQQQFFVVVDVMMMINPKRRNI